MTRAPSLFLAILFLFASASSCWAAKWGQEDGTGIYGDAVKYDFASKELTILKDSDGKELIISGSDLNFASKCRLIASSQAFRKALKNHRPPMFPILMVILFGVLATAIPIFVGLWGGAQVLGSVAGVGRHLKAFGKVIIVVAVQIAVTFLGLLVMDSDAPIIPDKDADFLLIMMVMVLGLLAIALVLSIHYKRSYRAGLGITLLGGVFAAIVGTAMMLVGLYFLLKVDTVDRLITRFVFEPMGWF
ncbi:MAG: hypothetical protein ACI8UO_000547 [Verrucomicrobiales bacterium]|jgi:hypothetical protein